MGNSTMLRQGACPSCDSSDAYTEYDDGHSHCFSCGRTWQPEVDGVTEVHIDALGEAAEPYYRVAPKTESPSFFKQVFTDLPHRRLSVETCKKFGYGVDTALSPAFEVAPYYDATGQLVAQKARFPDKRFVVYGDMKQATLFGQNIWRDHGKIIVITEGEIDAMSVSQAQGNKWPVVSVPNGAAGAVKAIQKQLEWLEGFETVVLMFDMDEPGQAAARKCAELFSPQKAKIAQLLLKDANDMLVAGRSAEIIDAIFGAKSFRPHGIVADEEVWAALTSKDVGRSVPYPWSALNGCLKGLRTSELLTLCAGTGIGKSSVCRELAYHLIQKGERVGYIALEENVRRSAQGLLSVHLSRPLHLESEAGAEADLVLRKAYEEVIQGGKVYFYDHFGSLESDILLSKIRYLAKGLGCSFVILDHISIVVSGIDTGDERKAIDVTMTSLRSLVQETGIGLILVSHLKRPEGKGHEEGRAVSTGDLRGSASIGQISDTIIGLERNQQDELRKNVMSLRVLKDRFTGYTGSPCKLSYEPVTGRLSEVAGFGEEY